MPYQLTTADGLKRRLFVYVTQTSFYTKTRHFSLPLSMVLSVNNMAINHIFRFEKLSDSGSLIVSFQSDDSGLCFLLRAV